MSTRIVLCYPVEPKHIQQIAAAMPEAEIVDAGQERIADELFTADIFCGHAKVPVDWDGVVRQGRLRWIQSSAAGMDHCLVPSVIDSDIAVTQRLGRAGRSGGRAHHRPVDGLVPQPAGLLPRPAKKEFIRRPTRDLTRSDGGHRGPRRRRAGGWPSCWPPFETRILATDMFPVDKPEYVEALWPADRLDDLLAAVDVVVLCLPLNDSTRGMIDARGLGQDEAGRAVGQRRPGTAGGRGRPGCCLGRRASGRGGDGRDRSRAAAAGEPALGHART